MKSGAGGIKIALCQMKVVPGRPDINTGYIVEEIKEAAKRGVEIIFFPEMCVTGYFIGDLFEDEAFLRDTQELNREIREATTDGIIAVVGTSVLAPGRKGEDGSSRLLNAGVVYGGGKYLGHAVKTLQPNYRMFDDDRHFFSMRKLAAENGTELSDSLDTIDVPLKRGQRLRLGVMLCEDMWHEFYPVNPAKILTDKGAELICNLSASPWTWQKNRKRHMVVRRLAQDCRVPFVYVNNTGTQNTGKNIIVFDGSSTVYNKSGQPVFEVEAYEDGTRDLVLEDNLPALVESSQNDTRDLYLAMRTSVREFFAALPPERRKVVVGISGGIDSALTAALYADILGPSNVFGLNLPSKFNSTQTKNLAAKIAANLGLAYEIRSIQEIADLIAKQSGVREGTLAYENIQARSRMEVIAARAQELGCVFSANWNKVEAGFGYGTLYGDMAGAIAVIGDLVKREVYQLADYLNREVFKREVIPQECFEIAPTAELRDNQKDPFDYGRLNSRGYHEELLRAFIEFRRNPEWALELHSRGTLETELRLEAGRLKKIFPTSRHFIHDLEKHWRMYCGAYFKRIQGPPIPIVSKRAFGTDLREAMMSPHFTGRYFQLRSEILAKEKRRVAVYGGSFNPPALHHRQITLQLLEWFDEVVIVPCGLRADKNSLAPTPLTARKEMALRNFKDIPGVSIDVDDLDKDVFTPAYALDEKYKKIHGEDAEVWHIIGGDLVKGGREGKSVIQLSWKKGAEIWQKLNFTVIARPGIDLAKEDLPACSEVIEIEDLIGSSTIIRDRIARGEDADKLLLPEVRDYIINQGLYIQPKGAGIC